MPADTMGIRFGTWRLCALAGPLFLVGYLATRGYLGFNILLIPAVFRAICRLEQEQVGPGRACPQN